MKISFEHENPKALICGYCKSGTTIITKTYSYCVNLPYQNEIRKLWGITKLANIDQPPSNSIAETIMENGLWLSALPDVTEKTILKFPEGMLVLNLFPKFTRVICVVRHPLDTICAYLEREYEFKTLSFPEDDLIRIAREWNYYILCISSCPRDYLLIKYEDFIDNPKQAIERIADFTRQEWVNPIPKWVNEQAQKYQKFVPGGQPIRGIGRYSKSIKNQDVIDKIIDVCLPALSYLQKKQIYLL